MPPYHMYQNASMLLINIHYTGRTKSTVFTHESCALTWVLEPLASTSYVSIPNGHPRPFNPHLPDEVEER